MFWSTLGYLADIPIAKSDEQVGRNCLRALTSKLLDLQQLIFKARTRLLSERDRGRTKSKTRQLQLPHMTHPVHLAVNATVWAAVEGTGYCGYEALRQILTPGSPPFRLSDPGLRSTLKTFLLQLLPCLPLDLHQDICTRVRNAAAHLDTDSPLPRHAWCHMDLILSFAARERLPFRTPGAPLSTHHDGLDNIVQFLRTLSCLHPV
jgi:hypothetical protein